jgi:hypothetical protein
MPGPFCLTLLLLSRFTTASLPHGIIVFIELVNFILVEALEMIRPDSMEVAFDS